MPEESALNASLKLDFGGGNINGFEWMEGPSDVSIMLEYNAQGLVCEPCLSDVEPADELRSITLYNKDQAITGYHKLILFKGASYVLTQSMSRVARNCNFQEVLPVLLGLSEPAPSSHGHM